MKIHRKPQVMQAIADGCNTVRDVAEATGLTWHQALNSTRHLMRSGVIKDTGRVIHAGLGTRPSKVFELTKEDFE